MKFIKDQSNITIQLIIKILQSYSEDFDVGAQTFIGINEDKYEEVANEILKVIAFNYIS